MILANCVSANKIHYITYPFALLNNTSCIFYRVVMFLVTSIGFSSRPNVTGVIVTIIILMHVGNYEKCAFCRKCKKSPYGEYLGSEMS